MLQSSPRHPSRHAHTPPTHAPRPEQSLGQMPTSHRTPRQPAKHSHATPLHRPLKPQGSAPTPVAYGLAQGASSAARPPVPPAATEQSSPDHVV